MAIKAYVPILRPKQGEIWAIRDLSELARERITPFFDVHRVQIKNGRKEKSLDKHLESISQQICQYWPPKKELFWDLYSIDLSERLQNGKHPVLGFGESLFQSNMVAVPTLGTDRDDSYLKAIQGLIRKGIADSICLRILPDDLETPNEAVNEVRRILNRLGVSQSNCHLLIDMRVIKESQIENTIEAVSEFTNSVDINKWKTFIFSSSSFPIDMSGYPPDSECRIPRVEIKLWDALMEAEPLIGRKSNYSDYAIINAERPDVDPLRIRAGGKIRYAIEREWIIVKGHGLHKGNKFDQFRDLSSKILSFPEYRGTSYSWGDDFLYKCSKGSVGTGNLTTWVRVDTNHHLTLVGEQISNLFGS